MVVALSYICQVLKTRTNTSLALDFYRAILRIILVLHHDFPEFLAENHYRLCNAIPAHCTQLHNLILSAYPSSFPELPNPFVTGLKVDRLEEIRKAPRISRDFLIPLASANFQDALNAHLVGSDASNNSLARILEAVQTPPSNNGLTADSTLLHAIVLQIAQSATSATSQKGGPPFEADSPQASLLISLARELQPDARYYFVCAMVNQLRYPNSHTQYFSYALLHLFGTDLADQDEADIRQQIVRVLLERLHVVKPHPWGLVITMLELMKNPEYNFWQLPFVKAAPAVNPPLAEDCLE